MYFFKMIFNIAMFNYYLMVHKQWFPDHVFWVSKKVEIPSVGQSRNVWPIFNNQCGIDSLVGGDWNHG